MKNKSLEEKYLEWYSSGLENDLRQAWHAGYTLSQKEMQKKLDEAVEIIEELFEWDNLTSNEVFKLQERFKKIGE